MAWYRYIFITYLSYQIMLIICSYSKRRKKCEGVWWFIIIVRMLKYLKVWTEKFFYITSTLTPNHRPISFYAEATSASLNKLPILWYLRFLFLISMNFVFSDWIRAGRFGDRISVKERCTYFAPVQTRPGAHSAPCKMGIGSLFRE